MLKIFKQFFGNKETTEEKVDKIFNNINEKYPNTSSFGTVDDEEWDDAVKRQNTVIKPKTDPQKENVLAINFKDGSRRRFWLKYKKEVGQIKPWKSFYKWLFKENKSDLDTFALQYDNGYVIIVRKEIVSVEIEIVDSINI